MSASPAPVSAAYDLLVDIGNTFVKWGRYQAGCPTAEEALIEGERRLIDEISSIGSAFAGYPQPRHIVISNVAGTRVRNPLMRAIEPWPKVPSHWISSAIRQCGVTNGYRNPAQLGTDRWAALIGSRALVPDQAVLVVVCGTATTIDLLTPEGHFAGGNILPGMGLMLRSLHTSTAALPDADGEYVNHPDHTIDAIASGCQHAQAGAIERLFRRHRAEYGDLHCLISGGAGKTVAPRLSIPYRYHDNLVLEGLYQISSCL
jgi:type III pantothenate kinase